MKYLICVTAFLFLCVAQAELHLDKIKLPKGFSISVYIPEIKGARSMTWGSKGTLFVGTRDDKVYAVTPDKKVIVIADGLNEPNGVAFKNGALYVAEISRIIQFENIEDHLKDPPKPKVVSSSYPTDKHHGWKFIAFGPDGKLYVPVGANCNICAVKDPYASITRLNSDGSGKEVYARGIRNTVGFDWDPETHELWFTDNGRDMMGDDMPSDELNFAPKAAMHFGYPFCHQGDTLDPEFGKGKKCSDYTPPREKLGAHAAALGMRFYTGKMFPDNYRNQIFIAEHGSWNRSAPVGYRLVTVQVKNNKTSGNDVFADGWLQPDGAWGRPVDVIVAGDGALLVSDDLAGVIYRIAYQK